MTSINTQLPFEIEAAVAAEYGGPVTVAGQHGEHVVMTAAIFRDMMGVGTDKEFEESVAEIKISLAQAAANQTMSVEEVRRRLTEKHGT
jgi:hypothetical protein